MALEKFIADVSPYGKVKKLRTDNGGEYMSGELKFLAATSSYIIYVVCVCVFLFFCVFFCL